MLKKIFAAAMLLIALPVVANAYTLKTWVQTVGGNIVVQGGAPQTVTTGAVYKTYTSSRSVTVTATTGYSIKSIMKNGVPVVPTPTSPYTTTASPGDGTLQSVVAQFATLPASLSASVDPGARGMVQPMSYALVKSGKQLSPLNFYFTPYTGQQVTGIDGLAGLPADSYAVTNAATKAPITSWPAGVNVKVKVTFYTLQAGATTLVGHFSGTTLVVANAGPPQFVLPGRSQVVTLSGAASTGPITGYAWTQTAGPETVALSGASTSTATFPAPSTTGVYKFDLTVTGSGTTSTATAIVNVSSSPATVAWNQCGSCHKVNGIGQTPDPGAFRLWSSSRHRAAAIDTGGAVQVMCYNCHTGALTGGHPGPVVTSATCSSCHSGQYTPHNGGLPICLDCHNPHSLAPVAVTRNPDPAYCINCHTPATPTVVAEWQAGPHGTASGHTTGICNRCHTTEGAIQGAAVGFTGDITIFKDYSRALWRPAPTATSGVDCAACHNAHGGLGTAYTYVNGVKVPWSPKYNANPTSAQYALCTSCHTLTNNNGDIVDHYHNTREGRVLRDSHYDNPATGVGLATNVVEGYVIRANSANPCADCHNVHSGELGIQLSWGYSGHAGKIQTKKDAAVCNASLTYYNAPAGALCTDIRPGSTRTYLADYQRTTAAILTEAAAGAIDDADGNAWTHYNWDQTSSRGSCQRCHTSTGAMNYLNSPTAYDATGKGNDFSHLSGWTSASGSPQQELLYCWACHSNAGTGALRNPGAITETYASATTGAPPAVVSYPDINHSNVCMGCHLGREVGQNIANDTDADGVRSFINSHYLAAGATLFNESGYEYAGQTYNFGVHKQVGMNNFYNTGTTGPCVSCHMTSARTHTFDVVTKDSAGTITEITAANKCVNCHGNLTPANLNESKHQFHLALEELRKALEAKGIFFYPAHPYFYNAAYVVGGTNTAFTNWAGPYGVDQWKNVMGAAFNYNLLEHDPGAYAHNKGYAFKLIQDSIDFLADGVVDGKGITAAFTAAATSKEFAETTYHPSTITNAASATTCADCHSNANHYGGTVLVKAQYISDASLPVTCTNCHTQRTVDGAVFLNTTGNHPILTHYAESRHGEALGEAWKHYDWRAASRASCARCHTGTGFVAKLGKETDVTNAFAAGDANKPGEVLNCSACHTDLRSGELRAPGPYTAVYTNGATMTFPDAAGSNLCVRCHSGRENGDSIKLSTGDFTNLSFINSHYLTAGGTVYASSGYEYSFRNYSHSTADQHHRIGFGASVPTGNAAYDAVSNTYTNGACVTCHYGALNGSHNLKPYTVYSATDTSINPVCVTCHPTRGQGKNSLVTWLGTDAEAATFTGTTHKARYQAALEALKVQLAARGIYFYEAHPYFYKDPNGDGVLDPAEAVAANAFKNWAGALPGVSGKDTMGAAFNYNVLKHDPGGVAHNRRYTRRLIYDAIDLLDDGALNYSVSTTLNVLDPATVYKTNAISYLINAGVGNVNLGTAAERY